MEYYRMAQDLRITDYPEPVGVFKVIDRRAIMMDLRQYVDKLPVQFYIKENKNIKYIDYIDRPLALFSDKLKQFLDKFLRIALVKPFVLADLKAMKQELYWMVMPEAIECLSQKSEFKKDGTLDKLVIDKSKIGYSKIFKVNNVMENIIIVEQQIMELIIAKGFSGIDFIKVEYE